MSILLSLFLFFSSAHAAKECAYFKIELDPKEMSDTEPFKALKALQEMQISVPFDNYQIFTKDSEPRIVKFIKNPLNSVSPLEHKEELTTLLQILGKFKELSIHCSHVAEYEKNEPRTAVAEDPSISTKKSAKALAALKATSAETSMINCKVPMFFAYSNPNNNPNKITKDDLIEILKILGKTKSLSTTFNTRIFDIYLSSISINGLSVKRSAETNKELILLSRQLAAHFPLGLSCNETTYPASF